MIIPPPLYVDVDGTLLLWHPKTPHKAHSLPNPRINTQLVRAIIQWYQLHFTLVIWSATGQQHAKYAAELNGLQPTILKKPEMIIFNWFNKRPRMTPL